VNRLLVFRLSPLNAVAAMIVIGVSSVLGQHALGQAGLVPCALGGVLIAALVCGVIVAVCLIERHLRCIAAVVQAYARQPGNHRPRQDVQWATCRGSDV
jgi:hypothetical protein